MQDIHITIEVAYALPERQKIISLQVEPGTTADEAVTRSGILREFPEIEYPGCKVGIFGKATESDTVLKPGDRVEIYRPLIADPKEVRRQRAAAGKKMKKGGGDI